MSFTPTDIAGCVLWLKADTLTQADGTNLTSWSDNSGNGNNGTISNATYPVVKTNIKNGMPVVRFVRNADAINGSFSTSGATGYTFFTVVQTSANTTDSGQVAVWGTGANGGTTGVRWSGGIGSSASDGLGWAGPSSNINLGSGATANVLNTWYVRSFVKSSTAWDVYSNGTQLVSSLADTSMPSGATFNYFVGGESANTVYSLAGDIAEHIVYKSALSTSDRQLVEKYLANKWGISNSDLGLIGYWNLDEGTGTTANDTSGYGLTGTLVATPTWATTAPPLSFSNPYCLSLNGSTQYVNCGGSSWFHLTTAFTYTAWIFPTSLSPMSIISKYNSAAATPANQQEVLLQISDSGGTLDGHLYTDVNNYIGRTKSGAIVANAWQHVAMTYDGSTSATSIKLYVNGVQVDNASDVVGAFTTPRNGTANLWIGAIKTASISLPFAGKIDDVRVYNRCVPISEIANLYSGSYLAYQNNRNTPDPGMVGYWKLDDGSGYYAADSSGNSNTGTLVGSPTWSSSKPSNVLAGYSLSFNGSSQYVSLTPNQNVFGSADYSISAWFATSQSSIQCIFAIAVDGIHEWVLDIGRTVTGRIDYFSYEGGYNYVTSTGAVNDGLWHHVVVTRVGLISKLYVDGVLNATGAAVTPTGTAAYMSIGVERYGASSFAKYFNGKIDEVRLYTYALSAKEVFNIYSGQNAINPAPSLNYGLAGYWKLDDGSGSSAVDSSGNSNTGTLVSSPTWSTTVAPNGIANTYSLLFDGTSQYVKVPNSTSLSITTAITMSAWVKLTAYPSGTDGLVAVKYQCYYMRITTTGKVSIYQYSTSPSPGYYDSNTSILTGVWAHVGYTYDGSNVKLYVNGVLDRTIAITGAIASNSLWFGIGNSFSGSIPEAGRYFPGNIDDVRVYNRALSSGEMALLYSGMSDSYQPAIGQMIDSSLVGYWKLDEGTGTTAQDSSGHGFNGTLTNTPTWSATVPTVSFSNPYCLSFVSASSQYVDTSNIAALNSASVFTIAYWFKRTASNSALFVGKTNEANDAGANRVIVEPWTDGITYYIVSNGSSTYGAGAAHSDTNWHHVVMVFDGTQTGNSNRLKAYFDGVQETLAFSGTIPSSTPALAGNFQIGRMNTGTIYYSDGRIDDVRIYNRTLGPTEAFNLYKGQQHIYTANTSIDSNLIGHWKFDEGSGTTTADYSGYGNVGTIGSATWSAAIPPAGIPNSGSISCNSTSVNIGDVSPLDMAFTAFSFSLWVKRNGGFGGVNKFFLGKMGTAGNRGWQVYFDTTDTIVVSYFIDVTTSGETLTTISTFTNSTDWIHVAFSFNTSTWSRLYINGVLAVAGTAPAATFNSANSASLKIGDRGDGISSFAGNIDDVRLWNRAITDSDVKMLYGGMVNSYNPTANFGSALDTSLIGYWKLDEGTGTTTVDSSGSGNTGTLTNGPVWSSSVPLLNFCNSFSVSFDGSNDYVSLANNVAKGRGTQTICAWIKLNSLTAAVGGDQHIFYESTTASDYTRLGLTILDGGTVRFGGRDTNSDPTGAFYGRTSSNTLTTGTWYHVVGIWNVEAAAILIYVNGVNVTSGTVGSGTMLAHANTSSASGARIGIAISEALNGNIDEVRVYNRALSTAEIFNLYSGMANTFHPAISFM